MKDQDPAIVRALHRELNELFDWEGESLLLRSTPSTSPEGGHQCLRRIRFQS